MKHSIEHAPVFTTLTLHLSRGERFKAEPGAMVSMSPTIELQAKTSGKGLLGTLAAAVGGESLFGTVFIANGDGEVVLAPGVPGDIAHLALTGNTVLAQGGAYLAGSEDLTLSTQGSLRSWIGGQGLFLSKITGSGDLFLNCYGALTLKTLADGEVYIVDSGHVVAFDESIGYRVRAAATGLFSTLASGEGLVVEATGPGRLWMQTRNLRSFAQLLSPFISHTAN
jgi:uncharacterized protein (TIGR00266 family)